jgi:hypothetical protein
MKHLSLNAFLRSFVLEAAFYIVFPPRNYLVPPRRCCRLPSPRTSIIKEILNSFVCNSSFSSFFLHFLHSLCRVEVKHTSEVAIFIGQFKFAIKRKRKFHRWIMKVEETRENINETCIILFMTSSVSLPHFPLDKNPRWVSIVLRRKKNCW